MICAMQNIMVCRSHLTICMPEAGMEKIHRSDGFDSETGNILLAYRNIKANHGSGTPGTDNVTIGDIGKIPAEEVVRRVQFIVAGSKHGYRPKPVRRKDIPKPNGSTRPLGIPCAWDRLIQQCIKQVMEPICEAQFSKNSFGFRPQRSVEDALLQPMYVCSVQNSTMS